MQPRPHQTGFDQAVRAALARDALVAAHGRAAGLVTRWVPDVGYVMHAERRFQRVRDAERRFGRRREDQDREQERRVAAG